MSRTVRAALTQTVNAYQAMPARVEDLPQLQGHLEEIRRANVAHHIQLMAAARDQGVQIICFGELFTGPYFALGTDPMWMGLAEDAQDGPTVTEIRQAAREHGMIVVAPIYEHDRARDKRFNTAVVIDENGQILGKFRKLHIPQGQNEQGSFHEMFYYDRNDEVEHRFPVFHTSVGNIGVAICYDRHFDGVMWSLARNGAELVLSPAVTFGAKSQRMWHLEFPTDATRHNIFIGGSNRSGSEPPWNQPYFGESYFVGPNGVLENISTHPNLVIADVDLEELARPDPAGWNLVRDLRLDVLEDKLRAELEKSSASLRRFVGHYVAPDKVETASAAIEKYVLHLPELMTLLSDLIGCAETPIGLKVFYGSVLAYLLNPKDFLPDETYGLYGYLDDCYLVASGLFRTLEQLPPSFRQQHEAPLRRLQEVRDLTTQVRAYLPPPVLEKLDAALESFEMSAAVVQRESSKAR